MEGPAEVHAGEFHIRGGTIARGRPMGGKGPCHGRSMEGNNLSGGGSWPAKSRPLSGF